MKIFCSLKKMILKSLLSLFSGVGVKVFSCSLPTECTARKRERGFSNRWQLQYSNEWPSVIYNKCCTVDWTSRKTAQLYALSRSPDPREGQVASYCRWLVEHWFLLSTATGVCNNHQMAMKNKKTLKIQATTCCCGYCHAHLPMQLCNWTNVSPLQHTVFASFRIGTSWAWHSKETHLQSVSTRTLSEHTHTLPISGWCCGRFHQCAKASPMWRS